jgi:hypothetical protein
MLQHSMIPGGLEIFISFTASRPALGPIQPYIYWIPWAFSRVKKIQA